MINSYIKLVLNKSNIKETLQIVSTMSDVLALNYVFLCSLFRKLDLLSKKTRQIKKGTEDCLTSYIVVSFFLRERSYVFLVEQTNTFV